MRKNYNIVSSCMILTLSVSCAAAWGLDDFTLSRSNLVHDRFIYVPSGKKFNDVILMGESYLPVGSSSLQVYHNGRYLDTLIVDQRQRFSVEIGSLDDGFHQISFTGRPAAIIHDIQQRNQCPMVDWIPFTARNMDVSYSIERVRDPQLSDIPDALFNPGKPGRILGHIYLNKVDSSSLEATARLTNYLSGYGDIIWVEDDDQEAQVTSESVIDKEAQVFYINLINDENLSAPAFIEISETHFPGGDARTNGQLNIHYQDQEGLRNAIYLLIGEQRETSEVSSLQVNSRISAPVWGQLKEFKTLDDFGIQSIHLRGRNVREFFIQLPPHWMPTDVVSGALKVQARYGAQDAGGFDVWRDQRLLATVSTDKLAGDGGLTEIEFMDSYLLRQSNLGMRIESWLAPDSVCELDNDSLLWIDSESSSFTVPHRFKSGLAGYIPRFVSNPILSTNVDDMSVVSALNKILDPVRVIVDRSVLPITIVSSSSEQSRMGTINFTVSEEKHSQEIEQFLARLPQERADEIIIVKSLGNGRVEFVFSAKDKMKALSSSSTATWRDLSDGIEVAAFDPLSNSLIVLERQVSIPVDNVVRVRIPSDNVRYLGAAALLTMLVTIFLGVIIKIFSWRR